MGGMGSGGVRPGAGRKRKLNILQEIWVGARCLELWRSECERKRDTALATATRNAREIWDEIKKNPRADHRKRLEEALRKDQGLVTQEELEKKAARFRELESMRRDLLTPELLLEMKNLREEIAPRLHHLRARHPKRILRFDAKPQGAWPSIFRQVQTEVRARFGVELSIDRIKKLMEEARREAD